MLLWHQRLLPEREKKQLYRHNCTYRLRKTAQASSDRKNVGNGRKGGTGCEDWKRGMPGITHPQCNVIVVCSCVAPQTSSGKLGSPINRVWKRVSLRSIPNWCSYPLTTWNPSSENINSAVSRSCIVLRCSGVINCNVTGALISPVGRKHSSVRFSCSRWRFPEQARSMDSLNTLSGHGQTYVRQPAFCNLPSAARKRNNGHSPTVAELRKSVFSVPMMGILRSFRSMLLTPWFRQGDYGTQDVCWHQKAIQAGNAVIRFHWLYCGFPVPFSGHSVHTRATGARDVLSWSCECPTVRWKEDRYLFSPPHVMARAGLW